MWCFLLKRYKILRDWMVFERNKLIPVSKTGYIAV